MSVQEGLVHYLLNKPAGVVTTASDPEGRPTVRFENVHFGYDPQSRPILAGIDLEFDVTALAVYAGKPIALVTVAGAEISPVRVLNL